MNVYLINLLRLKSIYERNHINNTEEQQETYREFAASPQIVYIQ